MKTRPTLRGGNSRLNFLLWLLPLAFLFGGAAAQTYTKQNSRVVRIQADTTYAAGVATSVRMEAYFQSSFVNDANASDVVDSTSRSQVAFDLLDASLAATNITAAGKTVTYPQLAALIRQAALDRANAAGIQ